MTVQVKCLFGSVPILQMKKLRLKDVTYYPMGHAAGKGWDWDFHSLLQPFDG